MKTDLDLSKYPGLEKLPSRVISLLKAKGLKPAEAAQQMGIPKSVLSRLEKGLGLLALPTIYTICRYFNVSSDSLIFGTARYPDGFRETNGEYTYENKLDKLIVIVPHEKMIESWNIIRKAWEKGDLHDQGWIIVELEKLARQALQNVSNKRG
jgi:transcriptional regulator with XRE-family HTH domain